MELLRWKAKISVLWIIQAVAFAAVLFLYLIEGQLETVVGEGDRFLVTVFFFIPCIMAWFALVLKDSANRWISFVVGILYAVIKLLTSISAIFTEGTSSVWIFNEIWGFLAAALIIWYAWKMPKQEARV